MNYEVWLIVFGDNAQREAREAGCTDCVMDDAMQQSYLAFVYEQHGSFSYEDLATYGNLLSE